MPVQEMKKIRKQRREEREKEKQINIQTGLMEPPKDKVRLVNMPRVYGADGVVDATAIEMEVQKAQREREAAHKDRNLARKLTTSERKAKKVKKMFDDSAVDTHVQVCSLQPLCRARPCANFFALPTTTLCISNTADVRAARLCSCTWRRVCIALAACTLHCDMSQPL